MTVTLAPRSLRLRTIPAVHRKNLEFTKGAQPALSETVTSEARRRNLSIVRKQGNSPLSE